MRHIERCYYYFRPYKHDGSRNKVDLPSARLKIASYFTGIIPLVMAAIYACVSAKNYFTQPKHLTDQQKKIVEIANKNCLFAYKSDILDIVSQSEDNKKITSFCETFKDVPREDRDNVLQFAKPLFAQCKTLEQKKVVVDALAACEHDGFVEAIGLLGGIIGGTKFGHVRYKREGIVDVLKIALNKEGDLASLKRLCAKFEPKDSWLYFYNNNRSDYNAPAYFQLCKNIDDMSSWIAFVQHNPCFRSFFGGHQISLQPYITTIQNLFTNIKLQPGELSKFCLKCDEIAKQDKIAKQELGEYSRKYSPPLVLEVLTKARCNSFDEVYSTLEAISEKISTKH